MRVHVLWSTGDPQPSERVHSRAELHRLDARPACVVLASKAIGTPSVALENPYGNNTKLCADVGILGM
jgi:hypothetical protein